ncbi:uncharacterized protein LOC130655146 [Hydractinia symbiolongicarpus]|uniref:uncharacterized protein LOC130655146 n=1 Tax=Hydractinia symbiolongicarpus TaxID=13093 RepID=UPI00254DC256|nr:uncharacterized protein LOC130655146 [Hydractinia symbiolongicarpus]
MAFWLDMLTLFSFICFSISQRFEFNNDHDRMKTGKERYEKFQKSSHTPCWKEALSKLDHGCRDINDIEQSFLALQFANCHLEKSGLETFPCTINNFKQCTRTMGSNIVAFQAYTEFFTHVSDICFYLQSDVWREKTEATISKLSDASAQSLEVLSKSVKQQLDVLSAQAESLQNQKDMLKNEKILKEALVSSAETTKDVFKEVREHAQQQKTMFSETFDNIFQSVERLANLQKMLLGEFIGLQSVAFYFVSTVVCYLFTSAPRTAAARLPLFFALTVLIVIERLFVGWRVNANSDVTAEHLHARIWLLRKIFLLVAAMIVGVFVVRYKDFNKINYSMLQDIQTQILEIRKLQETQTKLGDCVTDGPSDTTLVGPSKNLEEATKQLELSLQQFATSTPHKTDISSLFMYDQSKLTQDTLLKLHEPSVEDIKNTLQGKRGTTKQRRVSKSRTPVGKKDNADNTTLNESRYNLRSRRSSGFGTSLFNQSLANSTKQKE